MATGDHPSAAFYERTLHLPVPMLNAKTFLKLLQIELSAHPPGAPVKKVCLTMQPVRPRASQSGLFLPSAPEPEKLELTLARIGAIVGESRVGAAEILDTHWADGFRLRRFAPPTPDERLSSRPARRGLITALRLFRPPLRASVVLHAGMPVRLTAHTELRGEIVWAAGPWHGSGEWWNEQAWAREEWDVVLQNLSGAAALYRLFRDPATGQWFVYGSYD
jgi:protein ImuB